MRKKILFIPSIYRVGERIYPLIPELSKFADVDLLQVHEMSKEAPCYGNVDYKDIFSRKYYKYLNNIYNLPIHKKYPYINALLQSNNLDLQSFNPKKYDLILFDDNRKKYGLDFLYKDKRPDCIMVANTHCNTTLNLQPRNFIVNYYKKIFDYCFVNGNIEKNAYEDTSYLINGGIPSNDALKNYKKTNQYILVITNFLGHAPVCPFEIKFDKQLFNQMKLLELQKKYNKKIIIKTKSRITQSHHYTKDHDYLESILPKDLNYEIITDFIDNNRLICDSFLVIGPTSTFCFKPIQKGIPTILINKAGITGNFYNYRSLIDINDNFLENVEKEINAGRDTEYINSILEGGSEYKSTEIYINSLKNLLKI